MDGVFFGRFDKADSGAAATCQLADSAPIEAVNTEKVKSRVVARL
jgi:hypothetical protein